MTIYEIAKEAKTSPSSVSRYLNNKKIKPETQIRIQEVLKKYNFKPNPMARALVLKSTKTIGIITIDIRNNHYSTTAYTFEQEFRKRGYNIIIFNISDDFSQSENYINNLLSYNVDGIVLIGSVFNQFNKNEKILSLLRSKPVVCANGQLNIDNAHSLLSDDGYGCEIAVRYLIQKGRKNIYFLHDVLTDSALKKINGFVNELQKYGIDGKKYLIHTEKELLGGINAVNDIFESKKPVDALICSEDVLAVGAINRLREMGIEVGKEVDVIGFNNTIYCTMMRPTLTSIDTKPTLQAEILTEMLDKCIKRDKNVKNITLTPELVLRQSA